LLLCYCQINVPVYLNVLSKTELKERLIKFYKNLYLILDEDSLLENYIIISFNINLRLNNLRYA